MGDMSKQFAPNPDLMKLAGGMEFIYWLTLIGKGRTTGWKWRKPGSKGKPPKVKCCKVDNAWYITQKEIARFWARAEAGEFAAESAGVCARKKQA
jgi:hypothetical protein